MRQSVATTAAQRIFRLLFMIALAIAAYLTMCLFDHAARADAGAIDQIGNANPVATAKGLVADAGKAHPAPRAQPTKHPATKAPKPKVAAPKVVTRTAARAEARRPVHRSSVGGSASAIVHRATGQPKVRAAAPRGIASDVVGDAKKSDPTRVREAVVLPGAPAEPAGPKRPDLRTRPLPRDSSIATRLPGKPPIPGLPESLRLPVRVEPPALPQLPVRLQLPARPQLPALPQLPVRVQLPALPQLSLNLQLPALAQLSLRVQLPALPQLSLNLQLPALAELSLRVQLPALPQLSLNVQLPALPLPEQSGRSTLPAVQVLPQSPVDLTQPALTARPAGVQQAPAAGRQLPASAPQGLTQTLVPAKAAQPPGALSAPQAGPGPAPQPGPRPGDDSATGNARDSGGAGSPPLGTVASVWRPATASLRSLSAADVTARGRTVRYSGPPS